MDANRTAHPAWATVTRASIRAAMQLGQRARNLGLAPAATMPSLDGQPAWGEHPLRAAYHLGYSSGVVL